MTRSVLRDEFHAFAEGFDRAYIIMYDLEAMLASQIPHTILTDSKSLSDVITKSSITSEKRLMIDIDAVRNAYLENEISDLGHARSEYNQPML